LPSGADGQALAALRVEFASDGSLDSHTHPGTLIVSVEAGAFGFTMTERETDMGSHDAMQIMRAGPGTDPVVGEPVQAGTEYVLTPGDWLVEPAGMVHSARSATDEPTVVLVTGLVDPAQPFIQCLDDASGA
jgi:quercetin dioxygenase-like cupin family protein